MFSHITTLSTLFLAALSVVNAVPMKRAKLDVWNPQIVSPTAGDVWPAGSLQIVAWNLDGIPESAWNTSGTLYLGFWEDDRNSENLDIQHPLAKGFKYGDLQVNITVPDVPTRQSYIIVLTGDSGNVSDDFTITSTSTSSTDDAEPTQTDDDE